MNGYSAGALLFLEFNSVSTTKLLKGEMRYRFEFMDEIACTCLEIGSMCMNITNFSAFYTRVLPF